MSTNQHSLKWRFDVNTFRLIGRDLITDRITAVFELVKNCYDANATNVKIHFINVGQGKGKGKIIISDNGCGMSFEDIRDKWMVVGTSSKRKSLYSPPPFKRRHVGEKGIGRFAVDKLGGHLVIRTTQESNDQQVIVSIDWNQYDELSQGSQLTLFTDIENFYKYEKVPSGTHGTTLEISSVNELWTEHDITRLERELEKLISPFNNLTPGFGIEIDSNEYKAYKNKQISARKIEFATIDRQLSYDTKKRTQDSLSFNKKEGRIDIVPTEIRSFGPINFRLFYFDEAAKKLFNRSYRSLGITIDGVKIYRDGVITTPFAEFESQADKKRDILGIDKRLWSGFLDKIGSREIIGILEISKDENPNIVDATNRQDFVDNAAYRELKNYIIDQLNVLAEYKRFLRDKDREEVQEGLHKAESDIGEITESIAKIVDEHPQLLKVLAPLRQQVQKVDRSIRKGIVLQNKEREEHVRKENIYISLMSLQDYAIHVSHAVRTSLGKVIRMAELLSDPEKFGCGESIFRSYGKKIFAEMNNLKDVIDFMLSYAGSNIEFEEIGVKKMLEDLLLKGYETIFEKEQISAIVDIPIDCLISTNRKFFEDIFQNLVSNSIKALANKNEKTIKCSATIESDHFVVLFSDNGYGIPKDNWKRVFDIYYTTTADSGGAGLGLYIVKTRTQSLNGTIEVIKPEFKTGCTLKLTFPFNRK